MRILFLCTDAYGARGGIALYNRDLIEALASHPRCGEVVVLPRNMKDELGAIPPNVSFVAAATKGKVAYGWALARALRGGRYDAILCGHLNLLPFAAYATRATGLAPLLLAYGIEVWRPPAKPLARRLVRSVRGVVSISEITLQRFLAWAGNERETFVLPNAIHLDWYGMREKRRDLLDRYGIAASKMIMTVGRLDARERYKGFDEVLEIMPALLARYPDLVYIIAGEGTDRRRLEEKAAALGVAQRVVFTGFFSESEKADLYALADAYVMPSRGEGFGFVFLEALASGVPVVASKHDGGREAVRDGALGMLVDPSSPAELRAAILDTLATSERRIPEGIDYFSFPNFERRVHGIVDELVPMRRSA